MPSRSPGFTLVEMLVVLAVLAIVLVVAVPSFGEQFARRRLEGVANELSADLQFARSRAVTDNTTVTLATTSTTEYTISGNQTYKTVTLASGLSLDSGISIAYLPLRGCTNATCSASDLSITVSSNRVPEQLRVTVNRMGRVQLCTPGGSFTGYATC